MIFIWKKIILLIFCMSIAGGIILIFDFIFKIPDEISAALYFLSIGIAASSVFNYYK